MIIEEERLVAVSEDFIRDMERLGQDWRDQMLCPPGARRGAVVKADHQPLGYPAMQYYLVTIVYATDGEDLDAYLEGRDANEE